MLTGIFAYGTAMVTAQMCNHLLSRKDNAKNYDQRERFHTDQMKNDERRMQLQEQQGRNAAAAQARELAHREMLQCAGQSLDHEIKHWPLAIPPQHLQRMITDRPRTPMIVFAPPRLPDAWPNEQVRAIIESHIREALVGYGSNDGLRPTTYLGGSWLQGSARGESALELLYGRLPALPLILLQMDYYADGLHLLVGCSGFAPPNMRSHPIVSPSVGGSLLEHMAQAARIDAKRLQSVLRASNAGGPSDAALLGPERQNTAVMELETAHSLRLDRHFRLSQEYVLEGVQAFGAAIQIAVQALADFYHWTHRRATPLSPDLLPRIAARFPQHLHHQLTQLMLRQYTSTYCLHAEQTPGFDAAGHLLTLSESLAREPVARFTTGASMRVLQASFRSYLQARQLSQDLSLGNFIRGAYQPADASFLRRMARVMRASPQPRAGLELEAALDVRGLQARRRINADCG
jgi:hypothetical protein